MSTVLLLSSVLPSQTIPIRPTRPARSTDSSAPPPAFSIPTGFSLFGTSPAQSLAGYHYSGNYAEINGAAWSSGSAMPGTFPHNFAYAVFGNNIYVFGISSTAANAVYQFNPSSGWTKKANMPTARVYATAVPFGNYIYVFGGAAASALNVCERYDPNADSWATAGTCANMPTAMLGMAGTAVPGTGIFLVGGTPDFSTNSTQIMKYDPTLNTYTKVADLATGTSYATAVYTNSKIYIMGGTTGAATQTTTQNIAFDPVALTFTTKANLTDARANHTASVSLSGQIYLVGGNLSGPDLTFLLYDPPSDKFTTFPALPNSHRAGGSGVLPDGRFVVFGDSSNQAVDIFQPSNLLYEYAAD